jgi:hypothetical protein
VDPVELIYQLSKVPDWLRVLTVFGAGISLGLIFGIRLR